MSRPTGPWDAILMTAAQSRTVTEVVTRPGCAVRTPLGSPATVTRSGVDPSDYAAAAAR